MSNIIVEETEYCKLNVKYIADNDAVSTKRNDLIKKFKAYKIPGFRQNKATDEAVKSHFKKELHESLKQELITDAVKDVILEKNIVPFGQPTFSKISLEPASFSCEFHLYKQPDFELAEYKSFEIPKPTTVITAEELSQKMLQDLRTKNGETVPYGEDDFVQTGDTIILDYKTSLDGEVVAALTSSGELLNVGRINIPGFSENLIGMKSGEERTFDLKMQENFRPEYANKVLNFTVRVLTGTKVVPAPLDDSLAIAVGLDSFEKLMESITSTADLRLKEIEKAHISDQISKRLIANHDFAIPEWISLAEARVNVQSGGQKWDDVPDVDKEKQMEIAANNIKLSLILQRVRENEPDAQLTDEEVFNTAKNNLNKYSEGADRILSDMIKNNSIGVFFNRIRDEYTLSFIEKTSTIVE